MIEKIAQQTLKGIENIPNQIPQSVKSVQTDFCGEIAPEIVKKSTADAAKAYGIVAMEKPIKFDNKPLEEYLKELSLQGKVEGKDYTVTNISDISTKLKLFKNGKEYRNISWVKNSGDVVFETIDYPVNTPNSAYFIKEVRTLYDENSKFLGRDTVYDINKHPYKNELVKFGSTPEELMLKLKSEGRSFSKEVATADHGHFTRITSFNPKTKQGDVYEFGYNRNDKLMEVTKTSYKNGNRTGTLWFFPDEVSYTDYLNNVKY